MDSISFRGQSFSAQKKFFEGTHRIKSPEETWEKISPLTREVGVTRLADITGLDCIGVPVTLAIRPQALTISVSCGKGLSKASANVSGLMEAIELFCSEQADLPILHLPYSELSKRVSAIPLSLLPYRKNSLFHPDWPERWILGWDLFSEEEVAVPLVSVVLNYQVRQKEPTEVCSFQMSSNGLGSGNHFLEAVLSGVYELIERDAVTCHIFSERQKGLPKRGVRLETVCYPSVQQLIHQLEEAGVDLFLYDCTVDTEVPVFMAEICNKKKVPGEEMIAEGFGAHLAPEVAMSRAITEAIQGRCVAISGSRDDIFQPRTFYKFSPLQWVKRIKEPLLTIDARSYRSFATPTLEGDLHLLLRKLKKAGLSQLIICDLSKELFGIFVVRILIPGLEGLYSESHSPGERAKKFAMRRDKL